jgi:hypothetical protein
MVKERKKKICYFFFVMCYKLLLAGRCAGLLEYSGRGEHQPTSQFYDLGIVMSGFYIKELNKFITKQHRYLFVLNGYFYYYYFSQFGLHFKLSM